MRASRVTKTVGSAVLAIGLILAVPVHAQMGQGMMGGQKGGPGSQQMSGMMHDMADQMMSLSGEMGKGGLSAAQQKQMGERMREMAGMMDKMSGMMGKGMTMDADMQKQMDQMRKRMDEMLKPAAKK